jgi:hypothetical protein
MTTRRCGSEPEPVEAREPLLTLLSVLYTINGQRTFNEHFAEKLTCSGHHPQRAHALL